MILNSKVIIGGDVEIKFEGVETNVYRKTKTL